MPIPPDELSSFFDQLYDEVLRKQWDRQVDNGQMTDPTRQRRLARMDDIGAILRALGEGQAVLTYQQPEPRQPGVPILLQPQINADE